ncbi:CocE/NonD family hydrolase [Saccharomonospora saliphila]|uniref:CocE/NonD family hydrolase n=1 Tax=Saccharomonospora saliphila TaxID=369829 RepID=UPI0003A7DF28|nr:CocE/NonD family hydrolase [Saccharomonospora saliphila]
MTMEKVRTRAAASVDLPGARYKGFAPGRTTILHAGYRHKRGALKLPVDVVYEKDVALTLRDGTTVYADVFRPAADAAIPAVVNWAPYGKGDTGWMYLDNAKVVPNRFGIPRSRLSGLQSWEGNDPAYWCAHGYAVVQVDARGTFDSEGDIQFVSSQEARDEHDAIEAIAALPWCSGKIGLAGNSWLAMSQWHAAAQRPAHLAAIAPWEGTIDVYRDVIVRGGVPSTAFAAYIRDSLYGRGRIEDPVATLADHPLFDEYWADKVPDVSTITTPAYVVASYSNQLHAAGTLRAWARLPGPKWLRIHNSQEWPDFYEPSHVDDLRRFFDRYLKTIDNGWEDTPAVRMAVLDPGHEDTVDRAELTFPPTRAEDAELYLDGRDGSLRTNPPPTESSVSYGSSDEKPWADFRYRFDTDTEVVGAPLLTVWVSTDGHDDLDLYVYVQKLNRRGHQVWHQTADLGLPGGRRWMPLLHRLGVRKVGSAFYGGPDGVLRVSRRGLDHTPPHAFPQLELRRERPISPGEVVEAEVPLWPVAMRWHAGEQVRLRISGRSLLPPLLPSLPPSPPRPGTRHTVHTGKRYASRLRLSLMPS